MLAQSVGKTKPPGRGNCSRRRSSDWVGRPPNWPPPGGSPPKNRTMSRRRREETQESPCPCPPPASAGNICHKRSRWRKTGNLNHEIPGIRESPQSSPFHPSSFIIHHSPVPPIRSWRGSPLADVSQSRSDPAMVAVWLQPTDSCAKNPPRRVATFDRQSPPRSSRQSA